ncbi:hypothetical protein [Conyzicola sp.]|uniref:hypothetical protein n=1 Tax=Conyzicola sp. TaxID=1969404 RepID=UPI003989CB6B
MSVIVAGESSDLSAHIQQLLNYGGEPVRRVTRPEELTRTRWASSRPSRAVLYARLPSGGGRELRAFRKQLAAQAYGLTRGMTQRASILVVAEHPSPAGDATLGHRLEPMLTRMRAAAQQELAYTVKVNALVVSGRVDGATVAFRVWEAIQGRSLPDSDFVVYDDDIRVMSIAARITEARS